MPCRTTVPEHTATAREVLGAGKILAPDQKVILETDPAVARPIARMHLNGYLGQPNYRRSFRRQGFTEDDLDGGGSDRLIDAIVAWGTVEDVTRAADVAKGHQLAAGDVNQARQTQDFGRCHCNEAGSSGPYRVHQVKCRRAVLSADGADRAKSCVGSTYVVDTRAEQIPSRGQSFLAQSEHVDLIVHRQACDQGQKRRDDPVLAGLVHPSRHDEGDLHGLSRLLDEADGPGGNSSLRASTACSGWCPLRSSKAGRRHTRSVKTRHPGCFAA